MLTRTGLIKITNIFKIWTLTQAQPIYFLEPQTLCATCLIKIPYVFADVWHVQLCLLFCVCQCVINYMLKDTPLNQFPIQSPARLNTISLQHAIKYTLIFLSSLSKKKKIHQKRRRAHFESHHTKQVADLRFCDNVPQTYQLSHTWWNSPLQWKMFPQHQGLDLNISSVAINEAETSPLKCLARPNSHKSQMLECKWSFCQPNAMEKYFTGCVCQNTSARLTVYVLWIFCYPSVPVA